MIMKKGLILALALTMVALLFALWLMPRTYLPIRLAKEPRENMNSRPQTTLHLKSEVFENLSLHLDNVEFLRNALIVQAALGPLIRFSNRGRYEPYVAKSWAQANNQWTFHLHDGLTCEDGQPINAETFRRSLIGSLGRFSREEIEQTPFRFLIGMGDFLNDKQDSSLGLTASGNRLSFSFSQPVGKTLLEYLAMSPFAFLCDANFAGRDWKSGDQLVSSGPYRIAEFDSKQNRCKLVLREDWPLNPSSALSTVYISQGEIESLQPTASLEVTYGRPKTLGPVENLVAEVPRALLSLRIGIEPGHFLAKKQNRKTLQWAVNKILYNTQIPFENYHRAESFFFGQVTGHETSPIPKEDVLPPKMPLKIRTHLPVGERPETDFYQGILFAALEELKWPYEVMIQPVKDIKEYYNASYDIAFDRSHVDATLDPEFIKLLFKSNLGPRYQDPGNRVSQLVDTFDQGTMTYRDFLISFNAIISDEAAILPLFHRGFVFQFSNNIDTSEISPLMSILRFEELVLK